MGQGRSKRNSLRSYVQYLRKPLKTRKIPPRNLKRLHTTQEGDFHSGVPFFYAGLCHAVHIPKCPKPLINCATLFQSVQRNAHWGRKVGHFRGRFRSHRQCHFLGAFRGQMTFRCDRLIQQLGGARSKTQSVSALFLEQRTQSVADC